MANPSVPYLVHGLTVSYFTRKVTGFLDYKRLPWRLRPSIGMHLEARSAGWNGGIPVVTTPDGELIWDSSAILLHLDHRHPDPAIVPADPALAFLGHLLDDFSDEWLYRHAVGTRWLFAENRTTGSWDIAREGAYEFPGGPTATRDMVSEAMTACLPRLGTTPENIDAWVADSLLPWQRALAAHVAAHGFVLGGRPALPDFALFGGNVAHFVNDPVCCRWTEAEAPAVLTWTQRMATAAYDASGEWFDLDRLPDSLIAVLAETGRHYLPWVSRATRDGAATVRFASGATAAIETTNFLNVARGVLLARYVAARSRQLDRILDRAGILPHFADCTAQATAIPEVATPPRPADNQPFRAGP